MLFSAMVATASFQYDICVSVMRKTCSWSFGVVKLSSSYPNANDAYSEHWKVYSNSASIECICSGFFCSVLNAHIVDVIMKYALLYSRFTVAVFVAVQLNWKTNKMKWERKKTAIHLTNDIADFSPAFYYAPQWNVPWGRTFRKKCEIFLCISNKQTSDDKKLTFCEQKRFSLKLCLRIFNMSESFVKKNILTKSKIIRGNHWFVNNCLFKFLPNIPIEIISKNVSHLRVKIMESVKNYKKIKAKKSKLKHREMFRVAALTHIWIRVCLR